MAFVQFSPAASINALLYGTRWGNGGAAQLSYSFPTVASSWDTLASYTTPGEPTTSSGVRMIPGEGERVLFVVIAPPAASVPRPRST